METRKDRMRDPYTPKLHDYVKWYSGNGQVHEGWVYHRGEEYISIEIGVKDKPYCEYSKGSKHCKVHILLVCPHWEWDKLEYIKSRKDYHDESHRDRTDLNQ